MNVSVQGARYTSPAIETGLVALSIISFKDSLHLAQYSKAAWSVRQLVRLRRKISRTKRTRGRGLFGHKMFCDIVSCSHTRLSRENRPHVDEIVATAASA